MTVNQPVNIVSDTDSLLRALLASSGDCIKILDLDGNLVFMTEGGQRIMEVTDFSAIQGCPWPDFWQDQGNIDAKAAIETARSGKIGHFQGYATTMAGTPRWWDVTVTLVRDAAGRPDKLLSVSRDITESKAAELQRQLLTEELQHRMKNTMAMVSAIASQTFRTAATKEEARTIFDARLFALNQAHNVLMQSSWTSAPIQTVVEGALAPHRSGEKRIHINGPQVDLNAKQALSLALSLHELATNAAKYGALSVPGGTINVSWDCRPSATKREFNFLWQEAGGPKVAPPTRRGFGSRLIEATLSSDFGGSVKIEYPPEGLMCSFETVLPASVESALPEKN